MNGDIEFMICSLINDDSLADYPALYKTPEEVWKDMSLDSERTVKQFWIQFMVRGYSDHLHGKD